MPCPSARRQAGRATANGVRTSAAIARLVPIPARASIPARRRRMIIGPAAYPAAAARIASPPSSSSGAAADVEAHEHDDPGEADDEARRTAARRALVGCDEQREQRHEQRRRGDDDRGQRRVDVLLAVRDEREGKGDLDDREDRDPAPRPGDRRSVPARQASASSTTAARTMRAHARKIGGTPSSTASLMKRYGMPHSVAIAANAAHARVLNPRARARRGTPPAGTSMRPTCFIRFLPSFCSPAACACAMMSPP